jgi:hypothetical protein
MGVVVVDVELVLVVVIGLADVEWLSVVTVLSSGVVVVCSSVVTVVECTTVVLADVVLDLSTSPLHA